MKIFLFPAQTNYRNVDAWMGSLHGKINDCAKSSARSTLLFMILISGRSKFDLCCVVLDQINDRSHDFIKT